MTQPIHVIDPIDPARDLELVRDIDVPAERVWAAWTEPALLVRWFTPAPWSTPLAEVDLRPGGAFRTVMRSPEGEEHDSTGCYLEVDPGRRLTWTSALGPAFRPATDVDLPFTATLTLEPIPTGTRYRVIARHADPAVAASHRDMGFHDGWGAALDQLVAMVKAG
jgi:uncharacterized protein YndB with AHSA1/START domain